MNTLLDVRNLSKRIGNLTLFENISFSVGEGQRLGLIARNGAGKSTLLQIICGNEDYESGEIVFQNGIRVGFLEQVPHFNPDSSVLETCLEGINLTDDRLAAEQRARKMLSRLSISDYSQPMMQLSGGQQKRVALARVLMAEPDLMVLDEPTNHLDLEMIEWLENYLARFSKALLMVTHDRYFLDHLCTRIMELDRNNLYNYEGNYAYFLEKREERISNVNANIAKANNLYRRELQWMRSTPQARSGKARYRINAFSELERLAKERIQERQARLDVKSGYIGSKIFEAQYVSKAFPNGNEGDETVILRDFYYQFSRYEKLGIVGRNGSGKSTFVKMLLGMVKPDSGRFVVGETVRFGYYSQEGMAFDTKMRVIDAARQIAETVDLGGGRRITAMQFLTHFLFPPERQQDYIYKLSGGERRRLYLCTVLMQAPNFLILDEPTNDLDIATLQVLEEYLIDFHGCVIIVSHDRYFMDRIVDHLLVFEGDGKVNDFPGNYTQYRAYCNESSKEDSKPAKKDSPQGKNKGQAVRNNQTAEEKQRPRKLTYKERIEMQQLEKEIAELETKKSEIETALCSGTLSVEELTEKSKLLPLLNDEINEKSMRWLELSEIPS